MALIKCKIYRIGYFDTNEEHINIEADSIKEALEVFEEYVSDRTIKPRIMSICESITAYRSSTKTITVNV